MDWRDWDALRRACSREWELGLVYEAVSAKIWWLIGLPLAVLVLIAGLLCLQPLRYSAETQILIGPRTASLIGLRSLALFSSTSGIGLAASQAQLIASRDLARRAIKELHIDDNPEFNPVTEGTGPVSRALILLGMLPDPARKISEDRILEAYQDRLQVSTPDRGSLVTIRFQSEDPELAAKAANCIAKLYLDMRTGAALPQNGDARIVSRAITPSQPLYPTKALLFVSCAAMLVMAFGGFASMPASGRRLRARLEDPVEQPRTLGQDRVLAHLRNPGKPNLRPGSKSAPQPVQTGQDDGGNGRVTAKITARILSAPFEGPGARGTKIVATRHGPATAVSGILRDFARDLAREGRAIVIELDESSLFDFGWLTSNAPYCGAISTGEEPGLCDLLNGTASFAEVIRRDPASRLHFLRIGRDCELNLLEFALALDALAETYDFLLMIAPPLSQNSIAIKIAPKADFAVLAMPAGPQGGTLFEAEARLIEAGAGEVLLISLPAESPQRVGRDAA